MPALLDDTSHGVLLKELIAFIQVRALRQGNPILAGQCLQHCIQPFSASASAVWENVEGLRVDA